MLAENAPPAALLPTIASAYDVVEQYLDHLADSAGPLTSSPPVPLAPVDALLIWLLAAFQPNRIDVVDGALADTGGASTVLCRSIPAVRLVAVPRQSAGSWRTAVDAYLARVERPLSGMVEVDFDSPCGLTELRSAQADARCWMLSSAAKDPAALAAEVRRWLESRPRAVVLVLGVGRTGSCPALAALVPSCAESPLRLTLLRELAPALASSRLAVVAHHANSDCEDALFRVGQLFIDHFQYLSLVREACRSAVEQAEHGTAAPLPRNARSRNVGPDPLSALRQVLEKRDHELKELRNSTAVKLANRLLRAWRMLVPAPKESVKQ